MPRSRVVNSELAPYAYICLIEMYRVSTDGKPVSFVNRSTGFLIAPNVIVTAGHSLSEKETRIQRIELYPFQNSQVKSERRYVASDKEFSIRKVPEYDNPYCFVKDDFGVIILNNPDLPDWTQNHFNWLSDDYTREPLRSQQPIWIAGYPIDKPDFELWEQTGPIIETTDRCLLHPFTTTKRNSGSPIWTVEEGAFRVVGIHVSGNAASCGARPENRPFGSAVLITPRVFEMIDSWIREAHTQREHLDKDFRLAL
jgi:glutamyl endopeptidase